MKIGFGRIEDIHNIGGYRLTPEEALQVAKMRCSSIGLEVVKYHPLGDKRRQSDIRVDFICKACGEISENRRYDNIYRGTNKPICLSCADKSSGDKSGFMSKDELQLQINDIYKSKDFSFIVLNNPEHFQNVSDVEIECINCGYRDTVILRYLKTGRKSCQCANSRSDLEFMTRIVLRTLGVDFEPQFKIDLEGRMEHENPRYDFAILEKGKATKLIECDGIQHFKPTFGDKAFKSTQITDRIKEVYAEKNNMALLTIKYDETETDIINKIIEFIKL